MLDLEVVPERSLGNEQWEFILGELQTQFVHASLFFAPISDIYSHLHPSVKRIILIYCLILSVSLVVYRNACCSMRADTQATMPCYQICAGYVQRGGELTDIF